MRTEEFLFWDNYDHSYLGYDMEVRLGFQMIGGVNTY